jgi:hypothetical protein
MFIKLTVFERDFPGYHISVEGNKAGFVCGVQLEELQVKLKSAAITDCETVKKNKNVKIILKISFFIVYLLTTTIIITI